MKALRTFAMLAAAAITLTATACRRDDPARDPAVIALRSKFDQVKEGWTQAEVRELMGDPAEVQTHTAEADESVETARGTVGVSRGETVTTWGYKLGQKTYVIEFAAGDAATQRPTAVYWKNVVTVGPWQQVK